MPESRFHSLGIRRHHHAPRSARIDPEGVAECGHGWSDAAPGVAEPAGPGPTILPRPGGAEEGSLGGACRPQEAA